MYKAKKVFYQLVLFNKLIFFFIRISERIAADQLGATNPDVVTPFSSASDAVKRLSRYHCLNEAVLSERDLELADEIFESTAKQMLDKKTSLFNKYRYLLFKESMVSIVLILYYLLIIRTELYALLFLLLFIDQMLA